MLLPIAAIAAPNWAPAAAVGLVKVASSWPVAPSKRKALPALSAAPGAPTRRFVPNAATTWPKRSPASGVGFWSTSLVVPSIPSRRKVRPTPGAPIRRLPPTTASAAPNSSPDTAGDGGVRVWTMAPNVWLARSPSIRNTAPAFGAPLPSPGAPSATVVPIAARAAPSSSATPGVEGFSKVRPSLNARVVVVVEVDVVVVVVADGRVVVVVEDVVVVVGA